jgi:hypothetical protein
MEVGQPGVSRPKTGGRAAGTPNKATAEARQAIATFVDQNAHRLVEWLDRVSEENPAKAFELFQSVIEYHVPKLSRSDNTHSGPDGEAMKHEWTVNLVRAKPLDT